MSKVADNSRTRRQMFDDYYKAHPEKLKGKSLAEAFAAMQRQATRNSADDRDAGHGFSRSGPAKSTAVARRVSTRKISTDNPMTAANTIPGYRAIKAVAGATPHIPGIPIPEYLKPGKEGQKKRDAVARRIQKGLKSRSHGFGLK